MRLKQILAPTMLAVLSAILLVQLPLAIADRSFDYDFLDPVIDVQDILLKNFADPAKLDADKMRQAMIEGMIQTLGDPHTVYVPPADVDDFNKDLHGTYVGIGCEVNMVDDYLTIISPMDGSPALEAGIMAGDVVLEIDGVSTHKMPIEDCIKRLMGEPGTQVTIKVRHLDGIEQHYTITRGRITTRTVRGLRRDGENWNFCINERLGLAYVRITQFNQSTLDELRSALDQLQTRGMNGLVLDLRDNPGGALESAVQMADLFLDEGVIVSVRPRNGEPRTFHAQRHGTLPHFPMLVLINGQSASASEIVAGALQENGRAAVLGTRSFGKGSVQEVRELEYNRGTLKYTTAYYYLPSGRNLNRSNDSEVWGVDPDPGLVVPVTDDDYRTMLLARREFEIIREANGDLPACADAAWIRSNLKDEQLAKAVEVLSARVESGDWPRVSEENAAVAAFDLELSRAMERRADLLEAIKQIDARIGELRALASEAGKPPLLPPDVDCTKGTITVRDKHGNIIGTFRIESGNLEIALDTLSLTPLAEGMQK